LHTIFLPAVSSFGKALLNRTLKSSYKKLQVNSRTEAVLRLGKSVGDNATSELRKSTVEMNGETADNGIQLISTPRIPVNKIFTMIGGGLLMTICLILVLVVNMPIFSTPTDMPASAPTPTYTPAPVECRLNNLINCSAPPIAVYVPDESLSTVTDIAGKLVVDFNNNPLNTSAVVFQFKPPLNVQDFSNLELVGASAQSFMFMVEYKVNENNQLRIVKISAPQSFPAISETTTITIPISYSGSIDEIAINFFTRGQSSKLIIESIRLK
jgi:hypothetical protein